MYMYISVCIPYLLSLLKAVIPFLWPFVKSPILPPQTTQIHPPKASKTIPQVEKKPPPGVSCRTVKPSHG